MRTVVFKEPGRCKGDGEREHGAKGRRRGGWERSKIVSSVLASLSACRTSQPCITSVHTLQPRRNPGRAQHRMSMPSLLRCPTLARLSRVVQRSLVRCRTCPCY